MMTLDQHDMDMLSELLAHCMENLAVIGGFPSQMTVNAELRYFLCLWPKEAVEQVADLLLIWDPLLNFHVMSLSYRYFATVSVDLWIVVHIIRFIMCHWSAIN